MKLSREELETIITFNEVVDSKADIETPNGRYQRTLARLAEERPDDVEYLGTTPEGFVKYRVPKKWVKIRAPRILSEEEKSKRAESAKRNFGY